MIYDKRIARDDKWRWEQVKELLEPQNSEPCISNLLSIFDSIKSDDKRYSIAMEALDFAKAYINDPDEVSELAAEIARQHEEKISHEAVSSSNSLGESVSSAPSKALCYLIGMRQRMVVQRPM